jgi:hypothetical protein
MSVFVGTRRGRKLGERSRCIKRELSGQTTGVVQNANKGGGRDDVEWEVSNWCARQIGVTRHQKVGLASGGISKEIVMLSITADLWEIPSDFGDWVRDIFEDRYQLIHV